MAPPHLLLPEAQGPHPAAQSRGTCREAAAGRESAAGRPGGGARQPLLRQTGAVHGCEFTKSDPSLQSHRRGAATASGYELVSDPRNGAAAGCSRLAMVMWSTDELVRKHRGLKETSTPRHHRHVVQAFQAPLQAWLDRIAAIVAYTECKEGSRATGVQPPSCLPLHHHTRIPLLLWPSAMASTAQIATPCTRACGRLAGRRQPAATATAAARCPQQQQQQHRLQQWAHRSSAAARSAWRIAAVQEGSEGEGGPAWASFPGLSGLPAVRCPLCSCCRLPLTNAAPCCLCSTQQQSVGGCRGRYCDAQLEVLQRRGRGGC